VILAMLATSGGIIASVFAVSRIAAMGIIFYLIMDIAVHWGVVRHLREEVDANPVIPIMAIVLNLIVLRQTEKDKTPLTKKET
jgi:hypothetical protein